MAIPLIDTGFSDVMAEEDEQSEQRRVWSRLKSWWKEDSATGAVLATAAAAVKLEEREGHEAKNKSSLTRRLSRRISSGLPMVNLPRPATFRRQNSERRERLTPVQCVPLRVTSVSRPRALSTRPPSPSPVHVAITSAPAVCGVDVSNPLPPEYPFDDSLIHGRAALTEELRRHASPPPSPPPGLTSSFSESSFDAQTDGQIQMELEEKWILNLSMRFRDQSPREKFFVTYAQWPSRWRRITISCDYRDAPAESLEQDLQALPYQRDKSARIYEAIRISLPGIEFYSTVTNLKLQTTADGRLHVHVTEDVHETIQYPSLQAVAHLNYRSVPEEDVTFVQHMSGFVYKVNVQGQVYVKKEIPGPDSVAEFLYEVNALHALQGSRNVVRFQGLVVDAKDQLVKGLLISYAEQGPLVDMIFDFKHTDSLNWCKRERWSRQIIDGLCEIHEAGFVQGDLTLSNIVIDANDDAKIIDINRRGCPVGWEPPEIARLIEGGQRISMYIGVKTDLFQLGMVLWALAEEEDEPERQPRPLSLQNSPRKIPRYFCDLTTRCLSPQPADRLAASALLEYFPYKPDPLKHPTDRLIPDRSYLSYVRSLPSDAHLIEPSLPTARDDIDFPMEKARSESLPRPESFPQPSPAWPESFPRPPPARTSGSRGASDDVPANELGQRAVGVQGLAPHLSLMIPIVGSGIHADGDHRGTQHENMTPHQRGHEGAIRQDHTIPQVRGLRASDTGTVIDSRLCQFQHVDSGLADMGDFGDSTTADDRTALASVQASRSREEDQARKIRVTEAVEAAKKSTQDENSPITPPSNRNEGYAMIREPAST